MGLRLRQDGRQGILPFVIEQADREDVTARVGLPLVVETMRALGVAALRAHLAGEIGLEEAAARVKTETRRYAKRQTTWLKSNMIAWKWFIEKDIERLKPEIFAFVDG